MLATNESRFTFSKIFCVSHTRLLGFLRLSGLSLTGEGVSWETKQWLALNALIT